MKRYTAGLMIFAFVFSFLCACNAMTPGPVTSRSQAAPVTAPATSKEATVAEETTGTSATEAYSTWSAEEETETELAEVDDSAVYVYAISGVNVRDAAGKGSNVIGTLSGGDRVEKIGEEGSWVMIRYQDGIGYVYNEYLTEEEP